MPRSVKALDCQQNQNRNPHYLRESHDHPHARDGEESVTGLLSQRRGVALLGCDRAIPTMEDCGPERIRLRARGPLWWHDGSV